MQVAESGTLNLPLKRWAGLVIMALAELTWLALRVTAPASGFLSYLRGFYPVFVTSLAFVMILVWVSSRKGLLALPAWPDFSYNPWLMILAHWVAFGSFFWLTIFLAERNTGSSPFALLWILAWVVTGLGTGVFGLLVALPASFWLRLVRQNASLTWAGIIIIAASWILAFLTNRAWVPLIRPTFLLVEWLLAALGQEVLSDPGVFLLGTPQFAVEIDPPCAGYEGIGLISVFVGGYLWLFRGDLRFPQAFILLPCGIIVIWLVNALRLALLVLVGTYISPKIAMGGFHTAFGWIGFIAVALAIVAVIWRFPFFSVKQATATEDREDDPTAAYLAPLMALLAIILVTRAFSSEFDWLYPLRVLGTTAVICFCWRSRWLRLDWADLWSGHAVMIGVAVFILWLALERISGNADTGSVISGSLAAMPTGLAAGWLMFRILGSSITVPIAEELAFRGYVLRRLISADFDKRAPRFTWLSFLLSSLLFGVLHGRWLAGTVAGMFYAWAMYRRGRLGDAILAHATTNALIAADVLLLGNWSLWN